MTGLERQHYNDISRIATALEKIVKMMEATSPLGSAEPKTYYAESAPYDVDGQTGFKK